MMTNTTEPAVIEKPQLPEEAMGAKRPNVGEEEVLNGDHKRVKVDNEPTPEEESHVTPTSETSASPRTPEEADVIGKCARQIQYYLSDKNMKRDKFFHHKISSDVDNRLELKWILSCKKIQDLKISEPDVLAAIRSNSEHMTLITDADGVHFVKRNSPLPPLEPRKSREPSPRKHRYAKPLKPLLNIHGNGCLIKLDSLPAEATWQSIKVDLNKAVEGKTQVKFIGKVKSGEVLSLMRPFEEDVLYFTNTLKEVVVSGQNCPLTVVSCQERARSFFNKELPDGLRKKLFPRRMPPKPIEVGGARFESAGKLVSCCKELLTVTQPGTELKPAAMKVITALLEYHPEAAEKKRDMETIKVEYHRKAVGFKEADKFKAFQVVRTDGSTDTFSYMKCIMQLQANTLPENGQEECSETTNDKDEDEESKVPPEDAEASKTAVNMSVVQ